MYMDVYVASGLIIVAATTAFMVKAYVFAKKHIEEDLAKHPGE